MLQVILNVLSLLILIVETIKLLILNVLIMKKPMKHIVLKEYVPTKQLTMLMKIVEVML